MADCSTFDVLVVDWLYDELDAAETARFTRHIDGCAACWQVAESLVRTRTLMRALPEEEPPAARSARLLREAAAHAARQQRRGLGAWVSAWLTESLGRAWAHPAAAAVASLVLVAGVAGALFARDRLEMAAPRAELAAVHGDHAAGQAAPVGGVMGGSERSAALPSPATETVQPSEMAVAASDDDPEEARARRSGMRAKTSEGKKAAERARDRFEAMPAQRAERELGARAADAEEQTVSLAQADEASLDSRGGLAGAGASGAGSAGEAAPPQSPEATPPPQATAATGGLDKAERAQPQTTARKADGSAVTWAESRHAELRAALRDQQCARAVVIADDIQARAPGYYSARVAASKELAACRAISGKPANRAGTSQGRAAKQEAASAPSSGKPGNAE